MISFDDIKPGARLKGLSSTGLAEVVQAESVGSNAMKVIFKDDTGDIRDRLIFEEDLPDIELVEEGDFWSFGADGRMLRLAIEATRIKLAHHFDPYLAIHTSIVDPLPHQITAVYGEMLTRQPLRFLLADDPGAGKTIMAGLLIKELIARGDLERCLVIAPGGLVEQWQDELGEKFGLEFDILTNEMLKSSRSGNSFSDSHRLIARLDMLARNEELQEKLERAPEWDLIISDEAHRMSASYTGGEVKRTKRYQLGQKVSRLCRHFLLMSATPHNGKEEDFQLFMALLDGDRFEGRFRGGVRHADTQDMMRRLTKEDLYKFDGTPLFPERHANTVRYHLSDMEAKLYSAVTDYVREEMNRVQRFAEKDKKKKYSVGFALQILQRRLASSPAAIHTSLMRRRKRLEKELSENRLLARGEALRAEDELKGVSEDYDDLEEYSQEQIEEMEDEVSTTATSAETIEQLEAEIETLGRLEAQANEVRNSGEDTKWNELRQILDKELMTDADGTRRKLIVFTEPKDTLEYLVERIRTLLGSEDAVDFIHGGVPRDKRRNIVRRFMQDKDLVVLVANDAAGEGVNLQRGHLMVNYDLPWNPNKIEQRFGRIHRIGQTEVCHLWNLVAADTREGDVYARLLEKLEAARIALRGQVFDVLGDLFEGNALRDLLWEAIQYGEKEEVRNRLNRQIDGAVDVEHIKSIISERKLTDDAMPLEAVEQTRMEMEKAEAQRLQPHHIQGFFLEAFKHLGGKVKQREDGRFEIIRVPMSIRDRDRQIGIGAPVGKSYERICFDKARINQQPVAEFVCPGHPLLESTLDLVQEKYAHLLKQGAVMVDDGDDSEEVQVVFLVEHEITDGRKIRSGDYQTISKQLRFARLSRDGDANYGGVAPHLNLRPITDEERELVARELSQEWLRGSVEKRISDFAITNLAQEHLKTVRERHLPQVDKIEQEVKNRLQLEIRHWDARTAALKEQEKRGKKTRVSWQNTERRVEDLTDRLQRRLAELAQERNLSATSPRVTGGLVVVPAGLLESKQESDTSLDRVADSPADKKQVEIAAMQAVMRAEEGLGNQPEDVSEQKLGYDILSYDPRAKCPRFIEVKGRGSEASTVTVTRNEIITALNQPEHYILAIVLVDNGTASQPRYLRQPFTFNDDPSFEMVSVNYNMKELLNRAVAPS